MAIEQASQVLYLLSIHQFVPEIYRSLSCRWAFSATWYVLTDAMIVQFLKPSQVHCHKAASMATVLLRVGHVLELV
jgi:hypothetical protein